MCACACHVRVGVIVCDSYDLMSLHSPVSLCFLMVALVYKLIHFPQILLGVKKHWTLLIIDNFLHNDVHILNVERRV